MQPKLAVTTRDSSIAVALDDGQKQRLMLCGWFGLGFALYLGESLIRPFTTLVCARKQAELETIDTWACCARSSLGLIPRAVFAFCVPKHSTHFRLRHYIYLYRIKIHSTRSYTELPLIEDSAATCRPMIASAVQSGARVMPAAEVFSPMLPCAGPVRRGVPSMGISQVIGPSRQAQADDEHNEHHARHVPVESALVAQ